MPRSAATLGPYLLFTLASLGLLTAACGGASDNDQSESSCSGDGCTGGSGADSGEGGTDGGSNGSGSGGAGEAGSGGTEEPGSGGADSDGTGGADSGGTTGSGGSGPGGAGGSGSGGTAGTGGAGSGGTSGGPDEICSPTIAPPDTSDAEIVGTGTPASCTEQALRDAALDGGTIGFDCGPDPVTITLTQTIELPEDVDTTIDGGGLVTLDGGGNVRHLRYLDPDFMNSTTEVVLMGLTFVNGQAPLENYRDAIDGYPECAYGYPAEAGGGAVWVRNVHLTVIDCQFYDNQAALEGPDVGGGAIYALGAPGVSISGSRFENNTAANGGGVAMLFANPVIENSEFIGNTAVGFGQNRRVTEEECPAEHAFGHENQAGHGGLAGGLYFDGLNDEGHTVVICGVIFENNRANELAGALFRTPNSGERELLIDRSLFDGNTARLGGATFIKDNFVTVRGSTFAHNRGNRLVDGSDADGALGGLWINSGDADVENSTFVDNLPTGLNVEGEVGAIRSSTFVQSNLGGDFSLDGSVLVDSSCGGSTSGSNNLQWPAGSSCVNGSLEADPELGELGQNGGPTPTTSVAASSPAVGIVDDCPATDQRGASRPATGCTAGSVEP